MQRKSYKGLRMKSLHEAKTTNAGAGVLNLGATYPNEVFEMYIPKNLVDTTGDMHYLLP